MKAENEFVLVIAVFNHPPLYPNSSRFKSSQQILSQQICVKPGRINKERNVYWAHTDFLSQVHLSTLHDLIDPFYPLSQPV